MLKLTSDPKNIKRVESFVESVFQQFQLNPDIYGNILITLTEAVNNAINHGNCCDRKKCVHIKLKKAESKLSFLVTDEGCGFDFDNLPDPTSPENLLKIGGRGVFLMRQLSDEIVFSNNGSTVEIQFNI